MQKEKAAKVSEIIARAKDEVTTVLDDAEDGHVLLFIVSGLSMLQGRMSALSGLNPSAELNVTSAITPMKDFMGDAVLSAVLISEEEITPNEAKVVEFKEKVKALYDNFNKLSDEQIFNSYKGDQIVVKGVAQLAGVPNVKDREFDTVLLTDIRAGMFTQEERRKEKEEFEKLLLEQGTNVHNADGTLSQAAQDAGFEAATEQSGKFDGTKLQNYDVTDLTDQGRTEEKVAGAKPGQTVGEHDAEHLANMNKNLDPGSNPDYNQKTEEIAGPITKKVTGAKETEKPAAQGKDSKSQKEPGTVSENMSNPPSENKAL